VAIKIAFMLSGRVGGFFIISNNLLFKLSGFIFYIIVATGFMSE
jgi:hypothetical protein